MTQDIDPKYIIQALVRQRDEALARVAQLEASMLAQQDKPKEAPKAEKAK